MTHPLPSSLRALLSGIALLAAFTLNAQRTFYWQGGTGDWSDAAQWSLAPDGPGGAGVPGAKDDVSITLEHARQLSITSDASCHDLRVTGGWAVSIEGTADAVLTITGGWSMAGKVRWSFPGTVRLKSDGNAVINTNAIAIDSDVVVDGSGEWDLLSALNMDGAHALVLRKGTLRTNGKAMVVGTLRGESRATKRLIADGSMVMVQAYDEVGLRGSVDATTPGLMVHGETRSWSGAAIPFDDFARMMTTCGTGAGQTPFTVTPTVTTNFNGFGVSCINVCNGGVAVGTITGGIGPFNIQWSTGPNTNAWAPVCDGVKQVLVTDLGQSAPCFASVFVTEPPPVDVFIFSTNLPTCAGVCNGTATTFPGGGVGFGYVYDWNSGTESGQNPTQLCAGTNTLHLIDANLCVRDTVIVLPLLPLNVTMTIANASCFGVCDGTADVTVGGGVPPYVYDWSPDPITGDGTPNVSGLCDGNYSLHLTDNNGCDTIIDFTITEPTPIVPNLVFTNESCFGACDGTAGATPSGAIGPFTYDWAPNPISGDGTANVTDLCAGNYTVLITDQSSGCDTLVAFTIGGPPALIVQLLTSEVSCNNGCDGTASVIVSGGTPGYTITWLPPGTNPLQLCAGNYSVNVLDFAGCDTTIDFTISQPPPIMPTPSQTDVSCAGACDGTATVEPVTGGTGAITYTWTPAPPVGQNTGTASQLCAGLWCVTMVDTKGCDSTVCFTITEPLPLQATGSATNVSCGSNCDGAIDVDVSGGTLAYTYDWSPGAPGGDGTDSVFALCAGAYSVLITDGNGCTLTLPFTILPAVPLLITVTPVNATCPDVCDGSAGALVSGGVLPYVYDWIPGTPTGDGTPNVTGLCPGNWSLTITDAVGCDSTVNFTITAPPAIAPIATVTNATCNGDCNGSIVLVPTGGSGVYTYDWTPTPPNGDFTQNALNLCAGNYAVTITSGACDTTVQFTITAPPPFQVQSSATPPTCASGCDGTIIITSTGGATPPYSYDWSPGSPAGDGTPAISNLCAGAYSLTITDNVGCDTTLNFTLIAPLPIVPQLVTTQAGCGGACDATASAAPGFASYDWAPGTPAGDGTPNVTALCPGIYTVTITNAAGCDSTVQFTITSPSGITTSNVVNDATCADVCDGSIIVTLLDLSNPPYTYDWSPGSPAGEGTGTVTALCPGQWSVQITNGSNCDTLMIFNVGSPAAIDPGAVITDETCNGPCDGTASFTPTGGSGVFNYTWTPTPPEGPGVSASTQLCAGNWQVLVSDDAGCDTLFTFVINPAVPVGAVVATTAATCNNGCDGMAVATGSGGVGNYTYTWTPPPPIGQGNDTASALCAGNYSVLVEDANGCDTTVNLTISEPPQITISLSTTDETCAGPCTGTASVIAGGGSGNFGYAWAPPPGGGQNTANATGLCAGITYSLTVTDGAGCDSTINFSIGTYNAILPVISSVPANCNGSCDGVASVSASGGIGSYTYDWTPDPPGGDFNPQATGLCAGSWCVTITDSLGCDTTVCVLITEPTPIVDNAVAVGATCNGGCDANITVLPSGGSPGYTYAWTPVPPSGDNNPFAFGLCAGIQLLTITDNNGCTADFSYDLTDPPVITTTVDVVNSECQLCNGSVTLHASGGYGNFTFFWGAPLFITTTDSTLTNLCAGVYSVNVQDGGACSVPLTVVINDSDGETISANDGSVQCPADCNGVVSVSYNCGLPPCTVAWFDGAGMDLGVSSDSLTFLCPGAYYVQVTNGNGCISIDTANVIAPAPIAANISSTAATCPGACDGTAIAGPTGGVAPYQFDWSPDPINGDGTPQVTGLCAGSYDLLITDASGCTAIASVLILEPQPISASATISDVTCASACNGAISLNVSGGTGVYTYDWTPGTPVGDGSGSISALCAGDWTVVITDGNGCTASFTWTINQPQPIAITASVTASQCSLCNGAISISIGGGMPGYLVNWTDAGGTTVGSGSSIDSLCAGLYTANVVDANGCTAQLTVPVTDSDGETLTTSDGFTTCANNCDGTVSVAFTCGVPSCTVQWTDALGNGIGSANSVTDLCVGDYYVLVTNGDGCISIDTATVVPSQVLLATVSSVPASCPGSCDGVAFVSVTGGVLPYTYDWTPDPPGGDGNDQATGLCAGTYAVHIQDFTGCDTTVSVLILEPATITATAVVSDASCSGSCNGSIVASVSGGTVPYNYDWTPDPPGGDGNSSAFGLCAGSWTLNITDNNSCTAMFTWIVGEPQPIAINTSVVPSVCGACIGQASASVSGGTPGYGFTWTNAGGTLIRTDSSVTGLCSGLYTITITDANGCSAQQAVPISDSNGEVLAMTNGATTCVGTCDGSVAVDFICSVPTCTITWYDGAGNDMNESGNVVDSLCAGIYFAFVTNGDGCLSIDTAAVVSPTPISANLSTTPVLCAGDCNGTATVNATGGTGSSYGYDWSPDPINGDLTPQVTDLCAGVYSVTITDSLGCDTTASVLITEPLPISVSAAITDVACNGDCSGVIDITISGGNGGFVIDWSPDPIAGDGTTTITNLCAGDYTVVIVDANGCDTTLTWTISEPSVLQVGVSTTDNLCFGQCEGTASANVSGGTAPYAIAWFTSGGTLIAQDSLSISGLCAGDYLLHVVDGNGCVVDINFAINQPTELVAGLLVTGETCNGPCDGTAQITPSGGTPGYSIFWFDGGGSLIASDTTQLSGLCVGNYSVTVVDAVGCADSTSFSVLPYTIISNAPVVNNVTCNGACDGSIDATASGGIGTLDYNWTPDPPGGDGTALATGLCPGTWSVTITDDAGCDTTQSFTIVQPAALDFTLDLLTDASCATATDGAISISISGGTPNYDVQWSGPGGFTSTSEDITGLAPGPYDLSISDANNCTFDTTIVVNALVSVIADAGADITECSGGDGTLDGSGSTGATTYLWTDSDGNTVGTSAVITISGLAPGSYVFTLTASDGPCSDQDQVTVNVQNLPIADAGADHAIFIGNVVTLGGAPTGPGGSTFNWQPDTLLVDPSAANPVTQQLFESQWFVVTVTAPNGCVSTDSVFVEVAPEVIIPSGFTPNGDGWNDTWEIDFIQLFPGCEVEIYNRWGEMLFQSTGYTDPWDGTYNGGDVPIGTYYYVVKLNDPKFPDAYTGPLTILR